jgi:hypothetical protein
MFIGLLAGCSRDNTTKNFKNKAGEASIIFDEDGNAIQAKTAIETYMLPGKAHEYIANNYKGYKIKKTIIIVKANGEKYFSTEIVKIKDFKEIYPDSGFINNGKEGLKK